MRVLVVEDHEDLAANIGDFLASHGHTVDFALDGLVSLAVSISTGVWRSRLELLKRLMEAAPDVVPTAELEHALWGEDPPESNALSAHVYALRREIHGEGERLLLETVHGLGYRLDGEVERP